MNNKKDVIIIFDLATGIVHTYDYDDTILKEYDDYFTYLNEKYGTEFTEGDCYWMMVNEGEYILKENHTKK